jgi:hypothetical protein
MPLSSNFFIAQTSSYFLARRPKINISLIDHIASKTFHALFMTPRSKQHLRLTISRPNIISSLPRHVQILSRYCLDTSSWHIIPSRLTRLSANGRVAPNIISSSPYHADAFVSASHFRNPYSVTSRCHLKLLSLLHPATSEIRLLFITSRSNVRVLTGPNFCSSSLSKTIAPLRCLARKLSFLALSRSHHLYRVRTLYFFHCNALKDYRIFLTNYCFAMNPSRSN